MAFISASEIRIHGNLKSSNCVVDSRFVLKLTDFGLHSLRVQDECDLEEYAFWKSKILSRQRALKTFFGLLLTPSPDFSEKLWTAPELLRLEEDLKFEQKSPREVGTLKGDVYSFAIIVHEIIMRQGTFYMKDSVMGPRGRSEHTWKQHGFLIHFCGYLPITQC